MQTDLALTCSHRCLFICFFPAVFQVLCRTKYYTRYTTLFTLKLRLQPRLRARADSHPLLRDVPFYTPFTPKLSASWKLCTRWTSCTSVFHHTIMRPPIPMCREQGRIMKGRWSIGPANTYLPLHCRLRGEQSTATTPPFLGDLVLNLFVAPWGSFFLERMEAPEARCRRRYSTCRFFRRI
ncbi:unnamed protein product [Ixodes persulcatus]